MQTYASLKWTYVHDYVQQNYLFFICELEKFMTGLFMFI